MDNIYIISVIIAVIYLLAKFIEMRFIMKESQPMKNLIRDSLLVCFSTISGLFIANLFKKNSDYQVVIYEKNNSINLEEGYGIQYPLIVSSF